MADLATLQNVRQLAQVRPPNTNTMSVLSAAVKRKVVVMSMVLCNTTTSAATFSIFLDKDGTTYDQTTALFYGITLAANTTEMIELHEGLPLDPQVSGNLALQVGTANAITFTINGLEL